MRTLPIPLALLVCCAVHAQPGPALFRVPCVVPLNEPIDLTGDGVPDITITGSSVGTDDEPSSSGTCSRGVGVLPGTDLLIAGVRYGPGATYALPNGARIAKLELEKGLIKQELFWGASHITVETWGYGGAAGPRTTVAGALSPTAYVFRTSTEKEMKWGWFSIDQDATTGALGVRSGGVVDMENDLVVP